MKTLKKSFAIILSILCLLGTVLFAATAADGEAGFTPVLRFIASSDTHVTGEGDVRTQRIAKMLDKAYATAAQDPTYSALDAVLVVGDLTEDGYPEQFDAFKNAFDSGLKDGTQLLAVVAKNHDGYNQSRKDIRATCKAITGNDADFHVVVNGFHFIGVSASGNKLEHYDLGQLSWLNKQIAAAVKDDPNKPVFVMHHEPTIETTYGSRLYDGWGVPWFGAIQSKYPQVVEIAGHSHYPVNDPRSVWQGAFTSINTGAIKYAEFTVDLQRTYHPGDAYDTANCWLVEADAQGNLRLRGLDINEGKFLCDYYMKNPADKNNRDFTPAKRKAQAKAPAFAAGAALTVEPTDGGCIVKTPAAQSTDGMPVVLYRVTAKNEYGVPVKKSWTLPPYYRAIDKDEITLELKTLAEGTYTISVVAENAYEQQSAPLEMTVTVAGKKGIDHLLDVIRQWFADLKEYVTHLFW